MTKIVKNINAAQALLESYGKDSLSYFSLHDKKLFFFSSTGQSFLSYTVRGKIAIVSGDPIGPAYETSLLLKEFDYFVKGAKLRSCFLAVNHETLQSLLEIGHEHLHIGKEAVINLADFDKSLLKKKVRRAERYVLSQNIVCLMYKRKDIPVQYLNQLQEVSDEWLQKKGSKEKRFSMTLGRIPSEMDPDCEIVLAVQSEKVIGYLTFVPVYATNGLSLDSSRTRKVIPNGLTEFLLIQSFEYFKARGIKKVSLNFAAFYRGKEDMQRPSNELFFSIFYKVLSHMYRTNNLYNFNNKFLPIWQERYISFEKKRYLPAYLLAIAKIEQ
jgi:lysylphosphatidylglycerol synthetase-like protein (DUF2156 family)